MKYPAPYLKFADERGLDLPGFNTLRLGLGWSRKLDDGDRVFLANETMIIGSAKVVMVRSGPKDEVIRQHAAYNHVELALKKSVADWHELHAIDRRIASMIRNYGKSTFERTANATAIYLRRMS